MSLSAEAALEHWHRRTNDLLAELAEMRIALDTSRAQAEALAEALLVIAKPERVPAPSESGYFNLLPYEIARKALAAHRKGLG